MYNAHIGRALGSVKKNVYNARMSKELRQLHEALIDLVGVINSPQPDAALIEAAGVTLDRALFPLLMGIARKGPVGVVELADKVGRDHTTVSRQVAKLESLGLVARKPGRTDGRVREATITEQGRKMTDALDAARQRMFTPVLGHWSPTERREFIRLLRKFADEALAWSRALPRK